MKPVAFDEDTLIVLELDVEDPIVTSKQLPLDDESATEQVCPTTVHGLFPVPEQATILEVVP